MDEQWKPINGYEGIYEISNKGNIKRLFKKYPNGKLIKPQIDRDGYKRVCLCKNNHKKTFILHRLVAEDFIPNTSNLPVINHKDENKENNAVENLEWCSVAYNTAYGNGIEKRASKRRIPIRAIKGDSVLYFDSIREASETLNVSHGDISGCLAKAYGRKTLKGYRFEYARG
jgi:hypothetical protein